MENNKSASAKRASDWRRNNKDKVNAANRQYRKDHPEWYKSNRKKYGLRYRYKLTLVEWEELYEKQNGICANPECNLPATDVDHDHETGVVRGILCANCNKAIGLLSDNVKRIEGLSKYVKSKS